MCSQQDKYAGVLFVVFFTTTRQVCRRFLFNAKGTGGFARQVWRMVHSAKRNVSRAGYTERWRDLPSVLDLCESKAKEEQCGQHISFVGRRFHRYTFQITNKKTVVTDSD